MAFAFLLEILFYKACMQGIPDRRFPVIPAQDLYVFEGHFQKRVLQCRSLSYAKESRYYCFPAYLSGYHTTTIYGRIAVKSK
jgi:hypothetical protein